MSDFYDLEDFKRRLDWALSSDDSRFLEDLENSGEEVKLSTGTKEGVVTVNPDLLKNRMREIIKNTNVEIVNKGLGFNGLMSAFGINAEMAKDDMNVLDYFTSYGEDLGSRNRATTTPWGVIAADNVSDVSAELPHFGQLTYDTKNYGLLGGKAKQIDRFLHGITAAGFNLKDMYHTKYLNNESVHNLVGDLYLNYLMGGNKFKNYEELENAVNNVFIEGDAAQDQTFKPFTDIRGGILRAAGNISGENSTISKVADAYWDETTKPSKIMEEYNKIVKPESTAAKVANGVVRRTVLDVDATVRGTNSAVSTAVRNVTPQPVKNVYKNVRHTIGNGLRSLGVDSSDLRLSIAEWTGLRLEKGGGIHLNPKNKGKFTETKKRTGKTTEELTHSKNPLTRKRAIFAQNAKKWKHLFGGTFKGIATDNGIILQGDSLPNRSKPKLKLVKKKINN